jgi:hypothetical protein
VAPVQLGAGLSGPPLGPQPLGPFDQFSLGELQLLALGLWVLGEQERVDRGLVADWQGLVARIQLAVQRKLVEERDR